VWGAQNGQKCGLNGLGGVPDRIRQGYNSGMLRSLSCALLVASLLTVGVEAQRAGGGFHGNGFRGFSPGFYGQACRGHRGFSHRFGPNSGYGWGGAFLFPDFLPDAETYVEPQSEPPANERAPQPVYYQPEPEKPSADPQTIELPPAAAQSPSQLPPATMFILTTGERLEARRFVLTTGGLSVTVNRMERRIPLASLDLEATLAANRERGVNLQIPADHNEISLSF
jgi:hypothetical protein